jgi:hypothetical protein
MDRTPLLKSPLLHKQHVIQNRFKQLPPLAAGYPKAARDQPSSMPKYNLPKHKAATSSPKLHWPCKLASESDKIVDKWYREREHKNKLRDAEQQAKMACEMVRIEFLEEKAGIQRELPVLKKIVLL